MQRVRSVGAQSPAQRWRLFLARPTLSKRAKTHDPSSEPARGRFRGNVGYPLADNVVSGRR
eukprot:301830-Pyramimonas_sp.AAC.1